MFQKPVIKKGQKKPQNPDLIHKFHVIQYVKEHDLTMVGLLIVNFISIEIFVGYSLVLLRL